MEKALVTQAMRHSVVLERVRDSLRLEVENANRHLGQYIAGRTDLRFKQKKDHIGGIREVLVMANTHILEANFRNHSRQSIAFFCDELSKKLEASLKGAYDREVKLNEGKYGTTKPKEEPNADHREG